MRTAYVEQHSANEPVLAVALELAKACWKVALSDARRNPRLQTADAPQPLARLEQVVQQIEAARARWALPQSVTVVVVYEAGQDGFWLQRALQARGVETLVIDPASLLMERRLRRAKTDRLDALRLVEALLAWLRGDRRRFQVVRAPRVEDEDRRHWGRERQQLQRELQQHRNRIEKLLATVGCWTRLDRAGRQQLAEGRLQDWAGQPLGAALQARLQRELQRWQDARTQLRQLEREHAQRLGTRQTEQVARLTQLRGIGTVGARQLVLELFWRHFRNRRQLGACVGLVPAPYDSGTLRVDQGISKQGNPRVRALLVEQAWLWLRYQPDSALSHWFAKKAGGDGRRSRRVAIVALARRLVIALWRYLEHGELPAGATLKAVS
ncbi:IS110 family transposase [Pseudomonas sp. GCM10022186]|uniref:IS110 family transposase n=1 Tax=Pseudomonas sp. GCM10022186 TaxID=3252650 RepID=UPI00360CDBCA